ncbi:MAG: class I SAM-dependent methyltransferase [Nitrospira sp. LK70]|nr:class I SAM-dependent methyltransferase [Nitrospira sp. LK70]
MGFYCDYVFPRLMEWVMAGDEFIRLRKGLLASAHGEVLELGIGTGLNLPHYPETVTELHAVDPAQLLPNTIAERSARLSFPVRIQRDTAETLTYTDRRFDYVISTWTLCTIPDPIPALQEVRRVLKPGGRFLFLEHGRSDDRKIAAWQDRLNPIQNVIGCGCHLNRQIDRLILDAGLAIVNLDRFHMQSVPRLGGEMYRGMAAKSD